MQKNPVQCQFIVALDSSPKVEYSITEYGMSLSPILETLHQWGMSYTERKQFKKAENEDTESE